MKIVPAATLVLSLVSVSFGQLLPDQKLLDFQVLASLYAKQYAPYEWKKEAFGFDLYQLGPWLDRVRNSKSDLEFYQICSEYVASLNDAHDDFSLPSTFVADLGFRIDFYDGKPRIDQISRSSLPEADYPFVVGDEPVSVDGKTIQEWLDELAKNSVFANNLSRDRYNATLITVRPQSVLPFAAELGETARVVIRRKDTGVEETYDIPWEKRGLPLDVVGPVPSPILNSAGASMKRLLGSLPVEVEPEGEALPKYMEPLLKLRQFRVGGKRAVRGFGALAPPFTLPGGFVRRLGGRSTDFFYSGTYEAGGKRIGYIRIPTFSPAASSLAAPINQFDTELAFMMTNTDGLIVDVIRNLGGSACYPEALAQRLIPYQFRGLAVEIRATREWLNDIYSSIELAESLGADEETLAQLHMIYDQIAQAYAQNRGLTDPVPLCGTTIEKSPVTDRNGVPFVYDKPMIVLTDEFSASAAEIFAALIQDAARAPIVGKRTAGAGGNVVAYNAGFYSEGFASVTQSLAIRRNPIPSPFLPTAPYIENIGVRPDIDLDLMTIENLENGGATFVHQFTKALLDTIP